MSQPGQNSKKLTAQLSTGTGDDLRILTVANPAMIGTTVNANALLSDDADLYFKGMHAPTLKTPGQTNLQIAKDGENYLFTGDLSQLVAGQIVRANGGAFRIASLDAGAAKGRGPARS